MQPISGNSPPLDWRSLYEAAVTELDPQKFPQRLDEAQRAIVDRMNELNSAGRGVESEELMNALTLLRDLRKMAEEDGKTPRPD
jgi:hypothetical protein